jgi:hypothetical protein
MLIASSKAIPINAKPVAGSQPPSPLVYVSMTSTEVFICMTTNGYITYCIAEVFVYPLLFFACPGAGFAFLPAPGQASFQ